MKKELQGGRVCRLMAATVAAAAWVLLVPGGAFAWGPDDVGAFWALSHFHDGAMYIGSSREPDIGSMRTPYVAKLGTNGSVIWEWNPNVNPDYEVPSWGQVQSLRILPDGSSFAAGYFLGSLEFEPGSFLTTITYYCDQGYLVKLSPDGEFEWVQHVKGVCFTGARSLDVCPNEDVLLFGGFVERMVLSEGTPQETEFVFRQEWYRPEMDEWQGGPGNLFVARFNRDGTLLWARTDGGPGVTGARTGRALGDGGCVVAGGAAFDAVFGEDEATETSLTVIGDGTLFVARYGGDGDFLWVHRPEGLGFWITGDVMDVWDNGSFVVASKGMGGKLYLDKFADDGTVVWTKTICQGGVPGYVGAVHTVPDGSVLLSTRIGEDGVLAPGTPQEIDLSVTGEHGVFVARFLSDGTMDWVRILPDTERKDTFALEVYEDGGETYVMAAGTYPDPVVFTLDGTPGHHTGDQNGDNEIDLSELLRVIQFFNSAGYHCESGTEDDYAPGPGDTASCLPHASDYNPQDWEVNLSELLRIVQFFNSGGYHASPEGEDGFCPGSS